MSISRKLVGLYKGDKMGDQTHKRTKGFRNRMNKRGWLPNIKGTIAYLIDGSKYDVRDDGWRKIKEDYHGKI